MSSDSDIGVQLGSYELLTRIGAGGMAEVFAAVARGHGAFEKLVAIKRLLPGLGTDAELSQMLLDEARVAANIESPHVVSALDVGLSEDGQPFVVMPLVIGVSLARLTRLARSRGELVPLPIALEIASQASAGLHAAHEVRSVDGRPLGLVHRDVSPQNILLGADGCARVADFGVAWATARAVVTVGPQMKGKLRYAAPEQLAGQPVDRRADVYAFAVTLFELLSGEALWQGGERGALPSVAALIARRPELPPPAAEALLRGLAEAPDERIDTARALTDAIRDAASPHAPAGAEALGAYVQRIGGDDIDALRDALHRTRGRGRGPTTPATPQVHLRAYSSRFVGRERDIVEVARLLDGGARLLTLFGPGGIGKTRLAVEIAHQMHSRYAGGVRFCDLTEARTEEGIVRVVSSALGMARVGSAESGTTIQEIGRALARRPATLIILDNLEQVTAHVSSTVGRWMGAAPTATFLATSREVLRIGGERVYELEPLSVVSGSGAGVGAAVELFVERAAEVRHGFSLDADNEKFIVQIVRALDGLPLAIELAASRVRVMEPKHLAGQLHERFRLLSRGRRDAEPRQATLEAAIRWSWDLLSDEEQRAFSRVSVFRGGFDLESAMDVAEADPDTIEALVDKALLRVLDRAPPRFTMYESLREFAADQLVERGEADAIRRRHLAAFLARAAGWAREPLGSGARDAVRRRELENLLAAFDSLLERPSDGDATGRLQLGLAIDPLLALSAPAGLVRKRLASAIEGDGAGGTDPSLRVRARLALARAAGSTGDAPGAQRYVEDARAIASEAHDARLLGWIALADAEAAWARGLIGDVVRGATAAADAGEREGDRELAIRARLRLGAAHVLRAEPDLADEALRAARAEARAAGHDLFEAHAQARLADLYLVLGDAELARAEALEALEVARRAEDRLLMSGLHSTLGVIAMFDGDHGAAESHLGRALKLVRDMGHYRSEGLLQGYLAMAVEVSGQMDHAERLLREAIDSSRANKNELATAMGRVGLARVLARRGRADDAERAAAEARAGFLALDDRVRLPLADLALGFVALSRAEERDGSARAEQIELARERARQVRASEPTGDPDIRYALGLLEAELARAARPSSGAPATPDDVPDALHLRRTARSVRLRDGAEVSLNTRASLWMVLERLAVARRDAPGTALDMDALFAAGWPGERALPRARNSRIYVAISTLRGLGLKAEILKRVDGYLIDPMIAVELRD
ncbi:MAG: protein kinase [Sandaracinaceae bacterium]